MTVRWDDVAAALGSAEESPEVRAVINAIGETPRVSDDPEKYNDPERQTRYYSFPRSGVLLGFRTGVLDHAHFYIEPHEGYQPYEGKLPRGIGASDGKNRVQEKLGKPSNSGGGRSDRLIGYVYPWVRYEQPGYKERFEFSDRNTIRKVSLMGDAPLNE